MKMYATGAAIVAAIVAVSLISLISHPAHYRFSSDVKIVMTTDGDIDSVCSGVYLGHGVILTAKHCLPAPGDAARIVLDDHDRAGPAIDIYPEWKSEKSDVATYHMLQDDDIEPAHLTCRLARIGEQIEIVGNPIHHEFVHTWGRIASMPSSVDDSDDSDEVTLDAQFAPGNSGGPVYTTDGSVLGIVNEVLERKGALLHFAVDGRAACAKYHDLSWWPSIKKHWFHL